MIVRLRRGENPAVWRGKKFKKFGGEDKGVWVISFSVKIAGKVKGKRYGFETAESRGLVSIVIVHFATGVFVGLEIGEL